MDEFSYGAIISNNTLARNGYSTSWAPSGGIFISTASNVQVFNNIMKNNESGILVFEDNSGGSGSEGPYSSSNDVVHDNYVAMPFNVTGLTGGAEQNSSNQFYNHYCLSGSQPFLIGSVMSPQTRTGGWPRAITRMEPSIAVSSRQILEPTAGANRQSQGTGAVDRD
jgi:hypothetical protein